MMDHKQFIILMRWSLANVVIVAFCDWVKRIKSITDSWMTTNYRRYQLINECTQFSVLENPSCECIWHLPHWQPNEIAFKRDVIFNIYFESIDNYFMRICHWRSTGFYQMQLNMNYEYELNYKLWEINWFLIHTHIFFFSSLSIHLRQVQTVLQ